jgi:PAS domain S-box-containing protein
VSTEREEGQRAEAQPDGAGPERAGDAGGPAAPPRRGQAPGQPEEVPPPAELAPALVALLALAHDLGWAQTEAALCEAVGVALDRLYPGAHHAVRLFDPRTLTLTALRATAPLLPGAAEPLVLARATAVGDGLDPAALGAAGVRLEEAVAPLFAGSATVLSRPLAVAGALHGAIQLELPAGAPALDEAERLVLHQVALQAALAARNLRSRIELGALKRSLEDLVEHANALITLVDHDGAVTVWNGALARLTGVPLGQAVGRRLVEFASPGGREALEALLEWTLGGEAADGKEVRLASASGGEARTSFNTAPVRDAAGAVVGVVAIGQDLTRLHDLEAAAEQAEKMAGLGRLAAGIVHELNNPLTAVTMYAEALYEKWAFGSGAAADLEKLKAIREAGQRIQRLTRDLTAYARGGTTKTEPIDLGPLLDQAARMCKPALKEANATVERDFLPIPFVEGSRAGLAQCFVNLIANAAQAMKGGGTVRLGLAEVGGKVAVTVKDDGAGMTADVLARAFEPFFTTRPGKGIGLGLATARSIVERHGGVISLESGPGRGTTVTVLLPLSQA